MVDLYGGSEITSTFDYGGLYLVIALKIQHNNGGVKTSYRALDWSYIEIENTGIGVEDLISLGLLDN